MRYPTIPLAVCHELARSMLRGEMPAVEAASVWRGEGESIDFAPLDIVLDVMKDRLVEIGPDPAHVNDTELFEGELAVACYSFFAELPVEILDDPGFWRFLALARFWWFMEWREAGPLHGENGLTYIDAKRNSEQIPLRLYLRVSAVAAVDPLLAKDILKSTDFWRSHVIRVRTGSANQVAAAFVAMQKGPGRLSTPLLRAYAKRLNRTWTNTHLGLFDAKRAVALVEELRT